MKWRDLRMVSCQLRTVAKEIFKGLRFLDWGSYTESGNWFIVLGCWHAAEADARSGPQSWESLTNGFFGWRDWEDIWTCSFLRQYAERGYFRLLPLCSIEWEIYFSQARDCFCSHAGASCYLSLCLSSKSICVGNCFVHPTLAAGPAWLESPRGVAAAAQGLQRAQCVQGGHSRTGHRCAFK